MFQWLYNSFMNLLQSLSIVIAAFTAIYGINAWRRELKGQREFDVAEEALALIYECRDNLQYIRSPFGYQGEGNTRKRKPDETEEETRVYDQAYVLIERYEKVKDSFIKLQTIKYRFMALFGQDKGKPFYGVNKIINELFIAARRLGDRYWNPKYEDLAREEKWLKKAAEEEAKFWSGEESDIITEKMETAVNQMEEICSRIIWNKQIKTKKRRFHPWLWLKWWRRSPNNQDSC